MKDEGHWSETGVYYTSHSTHFFPCVVRVRPIAVETLAWEIKFQRSGVVESRSLVFGRFRKRRVMLIKPNASEKAPFPIRISLWR